MFYQIMNVIDLLVAEILKIPGKKIITVATVGCLFKIDIEKNGQFGYHPLHKAQFMAAHTRISFCMQKAKCIKWQGNMDARKEPLWSHFRRWSVDWARCRIC
jgi:hypothetical protein